MTDHQASIKTSYPLPVYNYLVTIEGDGRSDKIGFSQVSGLSVRAEPIIYRHGMSFVMGRQIIPGTPEPVRITLKKGTVKLASQPLIEWFTKTYRDPRYRASKRTVHIDLCDASEKPLVRWTVRNALPIKLDAPTFDASSNEVAIDTLELIADELEVNYDPLKSGSR